MNSRVQQLADELWAARASRATVAPAADLSLADAYAVAAINHQRRLAQGDVGVGRKIGHTNPSLWPTQGVSAPSWGWLYAASTQPMPQVLDFSAWLKPKAELEVVLRLGADGEVDAIALGLEIVDPPYHDWQFSVPAAIASGGVHAALLINPWQPFEPSMADGLQQLVARFQVGDMVTEGGSAAVLGSPLQALASLREVLREQGDPGLKPGDVITTGALAPSILLRPGIEIHGSVTALNLTPVHLRT